MAAKARIHSIDVEPMLELVAKGVVPVVAGFQGVDEDDNITTLGRGGSDTTAVALAAAIAAQTPGATQDCEIYTDVPAVFTADPRLVSRAKEIPYLSCDEMMEMAALGSKVLHIRCVEIAAKYGVKIHLRSTFEEREGTWILPEGAWDQMTTDNFKAAKIQIEQPVVSAVTHDANTAVFSLFPIPETPDFLARLFDNLAKRGVVVDIITQSKTAEGQRLAFSVTKEDIPLSRQALKDFIANSDSISLIENMAKISVVGVGMRNHPGVAARFFSVLAKQGIAIQIVTTSEIKISAVIDQAHLKSAAEALHTEFGLDASLVPGQQK
jgi:aspartate kinase